MRKGLAISQPLLGPQPGGQHLTQQFEVTLTNWNREELPIFDISKLLANVYVMAGKSKEALQKDLCCKASGSARH